MGPNHSLEPDQDLTVELKRVKSLTRVDHEEEIGDEALDDANLASNRHNVNLLK